MTRTEQIAIVGELNVRHGTDVPIAVIDRAIVLGFTTWEQLRREVADHGGTMTEDQFFENVIANGVAEFDKRHGGLYQPFSATGAELEFYKTAIDRWHTLPADAVLTEAARLFHFAVEIAKKAEAKISSKV